MGFASRRVRWTVSVLQWPSSRGSPAGRPFLFMACFVVRPGPERCLSTAMVQFLGRQPRAGATDRFFQCRCCVLTRLDMQPWCIFLFLRSFGLRHGAFFVQLRLLTCNYGDSFACCRLLEPRHGAFSFTATIQAADYGAFWSPAYPA